MSYQFYDAKIIDIIDETDSVKRFFVKMPDEMNFSFKAGQFIMFNLPIQSKYTNRSYSIASAPSADGVFEVCIVLKPDGLGTTYKWANFAV
jgi:ferredoxin-NADP reductase